MSLSTAPLSPNERPTGLHPPALGNQLLTCTSTELVTIDPPAGLSCGAYMDPYITFAGGYLADPNATAACAFCPFRTTDAYMQLIFNVSYGHYWRDMGIILGVTGINVRRGCFLCEKADAGAAWLLTLRSHSCLRACTCSGYARVWGGRSGWVTRPSETGKRTLSACNF